MATSVCVSVDTVPTEFLVISLCGSLLNLQNGILGLIFHGFVTFPGGWGETFVLALLQVTLRGVRSGSDNDSDSSKWILF